MNDLLRHDLAYVISTEEILWGGALLAFTIAIHGLGMLLTLHVSRMLKHRFEPLYRRYLAFGMGILVVAAWLIVLVHCTEILLWASFYVLRGAVQNPSAAFYYALVNYTTLNSGYLPDRWRLLEGVCAMAGLLTFAWSTGVLVTLAQEFQDRAMRASRAGPPRPGPEPVADPRHGSGDRDAANELRPR
jgi:hypothetical protein